MKETENFYDEVNFDTKPDSTELEKISSMVENDRKRYSRKIDIEEEMNEY